MPSELEPLVMFTCDPLFGDGISKPLARKAMMSDDSCPYCRADVDWHGMQGVELTCPDCGARYSVLTKLGVVLSELSPNPSLREVYLLRRKQR